MARRAKRKLNAVETFKDEDVPTVSRRERKKRKRPAAIPAYERRGIREFNEDRVAPQASAPLPTVSSEGHVKRAARGFVVANRKKHSSVQHLSAEEPPAPVTPPAKKKKATPPKELSQAAVRAKLAEWASKVVSAPEENVGILGELRQFSSSNKGRAAALSILTEAQLYKDLAPGYRIRKISQQETATKVSKDVAKLRGYEQTLLASYVRFTRSISSLARTRVGSCGKKGNPLSKSADQLIRVRRAAATAAGEMLRALPHFNEVEILVDTVCFLTTDREEEVRKEAAAALRNVLGEANRASGPTLATCVNIASVLSRTATSKSSIVAAETIEPLLGIKFAKFPLLPTGKGGGRKQGNFKGKNKKVNQRNAHKEAKEASKMAKLDQQTETEVMRDLKEADGEPSPRELFSARKVLLDAVCRALFNVIHSAANSAKAASQSGKDIQRAKKPPPALAPALHGLLRVAEYISIDIVEAILAELGPLLDSQRLPLLTRLRCLSASYAILAHHARVTRTTEDSVTADARGLDRALYAASKSLYAINGAPKMAEEVTIEFARAIAAAIGFREMPVARASAFAKTMAIGASALSPTHAGTLALVTAMQFVAPRRMVSCLLASNTSEDIENFNADIIDPDATAAQNSALWELHALVNHWHPAVRKVARDISSMKQDPALVTSIINVPPLVKKFTADGGGFNPPPQENLGGKKKRRNRNTQVDVKKLVEGCDVVVTAEERMDDGVLEGIWTAQKDN